MIYARIQRHVIAFTLILVAWTLFCAVNEVTWDLFDEFGSNYWLGFSAIANAILTLTFFIVLHGAVKHIPVVVRSPWWPPEKEERQRV